MKRSTLYFVMVVAVACTSTSMAGIVGSTYDFVATATGNTQIGATNGTYTDPANPGFCVGPPVDCAGGSGVSGSFSFADQNATNSTITFSFSGSTAGAGPGTFSIDLGNFTGGSTITSVTYGAGNLLLGDFSNVTWDGTHAVFTGSTNSDYVAIGGATVVFNVTTTPEPASIALILGGLGLLISRRMRRRA